MVYFTATELGMFVSLCAGSVAVILHAVQRSRCTEIDCGCMHCERAPPPIDPAPDPPAPPPASPLRPTLANLDTVP